MTILPAFVTPEDVAAHFGASARTIRETARRLGACVIIGKRMVLLPEHVERLVKEATPCPSDLSAGPASGIFPELSPAAAFDAVRARQTKASPSGSKPKRKPTSGHVVSMGTRRT